MENLLFYFLKVNAILVLFYVIYYFLLRKETFFQANRIYLLGGIVSAFVLPLLSYSKIIFIEPVELNYGDLIENATYSEEFVPVVEASSFDWNYFVIVLYSLIVTILLAKLTIELYSFFNAIKLGNKNKVNKIVLVETSLFENPFSFFNYLVYNKSAFTEEELEFILTHESIHIKQLHSIDVLVSKLVSLALWINPVAWLYRKAILQNLEFIADAETTKELQNSYNYQKTLLKSVCNQNQLSITNQFYQSLIKKRIVMLNTNPSNKRNVWKYSVILPALVAFFMLYQVKTVAQVKENSKSVNTVFVSSSFFEIITAQTTDAELEKMEKAFTVDDILLKISQVKRNKKNEIIEINLAFTSKSNSKFNTTKIVKGDKPIKPIKVYIDENENNEKSVGFNEVDDTNVSFEVDGENGIFETNNVGWTIDEFTRNGKKVDLIINGKLQVKGNKIRIPNDEEIETVREISAKEVKEKYKIKVDEGKLYYEVITKKGVDKIQLNENDANYAIEYEISSSENGGFDVIKSIKENKNVDYKKALIIYNGEEINYKDLDNIDPKTIVSSGATVANHAVKKYGKKGENGVIFLNTLNYELENNPDFKKMYEDAEEENIKSKSDFQISYETTSAEDNIVLIKENMSVNYKEALIILDGKEILSNDLDRINPIEISSISSSSGNENIIKKYGKKAKNGVIIIETFSYSKPTLDYNNLPDFKLKDGESFTISKRSTDEDLDFYKKTLQKSDCVVSFKNIKRNNKNEITSISMIMKKDDNEVKKDIKQSNPIDIIQIGILKNKPFIK